MAFQGALYMNRDVVREKLLGRCIKKAEQKGPLGRMILLDCNKYHPCVQ